MLHAILLGLSLMVAPPAPRPTHAARGSAGAGGVLQQLVRREGGGYEHADVRAGFTATIHADGTVSFRDRPCADPHVSIAGSRPPSWPR